MDPHYMALIPAYATAVGIWFLIYRYFKSPWKEIPRIKFETPALEFLYAIGAVVAILAIGQLYLRDLLIPNEGNELIDALNQFLIFSPTLVLVWMRKQSWESLWLPKFQIFQRIGLGLLIAICSLAVYWLFRKESNSLLGIFTNTYHPQNFSHLVQVFMEDITIALLFVRLSSWIGRKWAIGIVAAFFAAGHIPSLLANGATAEELGSLLLDTGLGVMVLTAVSKSQDVWWFFMVHFALDMMQFYGG